MKTHRQSVHGNLKCPHCDFVTYSGHGYKHHLKRHESLHTCKICNKEVPESNYELHEAICGADGKCPACNYETKSSTGEFLLKTKFPLRGLPHLNFPAKI